MSSHRASSPLKRCVDDSAVALAHGGFYNGGPAGLCLARPVLPLDPASTCERSRIPHLAVQFSSTVDRRWLASLKIMVPRHCLLRDQLGAPMGGRVPTRMASLASMPQVAARRPVLRLGLHQERATKRRDAVLRTSEERDLESGLNYFGARYYASSMAGGSAQTGVRKLLRSRMPKLGDPQRLSLHGYVGNNPLSSFDRMGHECVPAESLFFKPSPTPVTYGSDGDDN